MDDTFIYRRAVAHFLLYFVSFCLNYSITKNKKEGEMRGKGRKRLHRNSPKCLEQPSL